MQVFTLGGQGLKEVQRKMRIRGCIVFIVLTLLTGSVVIVTQYKAARLNYIQVAIIASVIGLILAVTAYRSIQKINLSLESYKLTLTDNLITREQLNLPVISLYHNEVKEIYLARNGNIKVTGKDPNDVIIIPRQISGFDQLQQLLGMIRPFVTTSDITFYRKYAWVAAIVNIAAMICVYISDNKIIVGISGILFVIITIRSYISLDKNKNIDNKLKRNPGIRMLVLASVIAVTIFKLWGHTT